MTIAIVGHHTPNYHEMASISVPLKEHYSKKHGYPLFIKTDNFRNIPGRHLSFEKCAYLNELMEAHPEIEWFWYAGCDCVITNMNIKLESLIDDSVHFIVCKDDHGINGDVFFIRNSPEGREYMQHLDTDHWCGTEQGHMWDDENNPKWRAISKYISAQYMNAYDLSYYPHKNLTDNLGGRLAWYPGNFVIQAVTGFTPDFTPDEVYQWKLKILRGVLDKIVY